MDQQTVNKLQNGNYLGKQQWGWYNTINIKNVLIARWLFRDPQDAIRSSVGVVQHSAMFVVRNGSPIITMVQMKETIALTTKN